MEKLPYIYNTKTCTLHALNDDKLTYRYVGHTKKPTTTKDAVKELVK